MANKSFLATVVGNLVADPDLRYTTTSNTPVARLRIASQDRTFNKDTNQWEDGEASFVDVVVWKGAAENVAHTLTKGMRVFASGTMKQRTYTTKQDETRTVLEMEADEIGPSLRYATAVVTRNPSNNNGGYNQNNGGHNQNNGGYGGQQQGAYNNQNTGGFGGAQGYGNTGGFGGGFGRG